MEYNCIDLFPSIDKSKNKESDKMNTIKLFPTQNESIKELPVVPKEEAGTNTIDSSNKIVLFLLFCLKVFLFYRFILLQDLN